MKQYDYMVLGENSTLIANYSIINSYNHITADLQNETFQGFAIGMDGIL